MHKETARGLYAESRVQTYLLRKGRPDHRRGQAGTWRTRCLGVVGGSRLLCGPRGPRLVPSSLLHPARPGEPPSDPAAPPPRESPVSAWARAHTHPSALKRAVGWESGMAEPLGAPRRHVVLCGKLRASPLKTQRSVLAGKGAWARTCC